MGSEERQLLVDRLGTTSLTMEEKIEASADYLDLVKRSKEEDLTEIEKSGSWGKRRCYMERRLKGGMMLACTVKRMGAMRHCSVIMGCAGVWNREEGNLFLLLFLRP